MHADCFSRLILDPSSPSSIQSSISSYPLTKMSVSVSSQWAPLPLTQGHVSSHLQPLDTPRKPVYSLEDLVKDIKIHLGESSGIGCPDVDEDYLMSLANKYNSNPNDWARYYYNCPGKNYTRNAIENINNKANILLLVWNPGKGSPIHDHANAHCILKVLAGELTETIYHTPSKDGDKSQPLELKSQATYQADQVTYINDSMGLHRVHNPHPTQVAVSLHHIGYNIFDEATGKSSFVPQAKSHTGKVESQ